MSNRTRTRYIVWIFLVGFLLIGVWPLVKSVHERYAHPEVAFGGKTSPDGRYVAYITRPGMFGRGKAKLNIKEKSNGRVRSIDATKGLLAWSPDSSKIGIIDDIDRSVFVYSLPLGCAEQRSIVIYDPIKRGSYHIGSKWLDDSTFALIAKVPSREFRDMTILSKVKVSANSRQLVIEPFRPATMTVAEVIDRLQTVGWRLMSKKNGRLCFGRYDGTDTILVSDRKTDNVPSETLRYIRKLADID